MCTGLLWGAECCVKINTNWIFAPIFAHTSQLSSRVKRDYQLIISSEQKDGSMPASFLPSFFLSVHPSPSLLPSLSFLLESCFLRAHSALCSPADFLLNLWDVCSVQSRVLRISRFPTAQCSPVANPNFQQPVGRQFNDIQAIENRAAALQVVFRKRSPEPSRKLGNFNLVKQI